MWRAAAEHESGGVPDIAAVLFDFGGVVIAGPFAAFADVARRSGASADAVREINSRNPDTNAWARAERGELDPDAFVAAFEQEAAELGHAIDAREIVDVLAGMSPRRDTAIPEMLDAIERCRAAGVKLGLITNNVRPMAGKPEAAWVFDTFDTVVESCVLGARKPEPAIYEETLRRLGVEPARAAMLDDLGINLKTARAMGITTIKVVDPAAAAAQLCELVEV